MRTFTLFLLLAAPGFSSIDSKTLSAIRQVESGDNPKALGALGERGAYQFRQSTWELHTGTPFRFAFDTLVSDRIALLHLNYIRRRLTAAGITPTTWREAAAWNAGTSAVINNRIPVSAALYANRVFEIVEGG